jgi:predicted RNA-binding Zn ribbon-like protein
VDFVRYAESSAALLNAALPDREALAAHLGQRAWLVRQVNDRDVAVLRRFCKDLRPAFEASDADDAQGVVDAINGLLERHPITPRIADHNMERLHIHVANKAASVADLIIGESLLGLANLVCDLGPTRLGVCADGRCDHVYVDTSPNQSRRYCSERCSSRANVAAYRARQKAAAAG